LTTGNHCRRKTDRFQWGREVCTSSVRRKSQIFLPKLKMERYGSDKKEPEALAVSSGWRNRIIEGSLKFCSE